MKLVDFGLSFDEFVCFFQRDSALESKVLQWIKSVIEEEPKTDYEHFIQDGSVISK